MSEFKDFERLVVKYISEDLTKEELNDLDEFLIEEKNKRHFKEMLSLNNRIHKKWLIADQRKKDELFAKILDQKPVKRLNSYRNLWRVAAVFALLIGGGLMYYFSTDVNSNQEQLITLNLDSGIHKIIENGASGIVAETDAMIIEQRGDTLMYTSKNQNDVEVRFDELHVPKGKTSIVALADGTLVNLNAGSSLRYPNAFKTKGNRAVFLSGEAYFQVSHDDKRPFLVHTSDLEIEVLGTHFNVQAYPDEDMSNTVLVTGSVKVSNTSSEDDKVVLEPGMQASYMPGSDNLEIASVSTATYTAWVKGQLYFDQMPFSQISRVLERKFDVQIVIDNVLLKKEKFTAKFKTETLEQIMKSFNESYSFDYEIKENTVVIK